MRQLINSVVYLEVQNVINESFQGSFVRVYINEVQLPV